MKNKKMILAVVALVVVIGLLAGVYFATRPKTSQGAKAVTITVVHSDGTEKVFECRTDAEYLGDVLIDNEIIVAEYSTYGLFFNTVDGETAVWEENSSYWALYIGEEYAMTGADQTPVEDGGVYKLVYTIG